MKVNKSIQYKQRYLYHDFQPIYNFQKNELIGYEALLRSKRGESPIEIIRCARNTHQLYSLEMFSIKRAIKEFSRNNIDKILFLNIFPSTIMHKLFLSNFEMLIEQIDFKLVLEISELENITNFEILKRKISKLQTFGVKLAMDDLGNSNEELKKMIEMNIDYIKLDKYFADDLSKCLKKQEMITLIKNYYKDNSEIILEGIEQVKDLKYAEHLGLYLGQGYLLGKPAPLKIISSD